MFIAVGVTLHMLSKPKSRHVSPEVERWPAAIISCRSASRPNPSRKALKRVRDSGESFFRHPESEVLTLVDLKMSSVVKLK
jgi:hypothetical protein